MRAIVSHELARRKWDRRIAGRLALETPLCANTQARNDGIANIGDGFVSRRTLTDATRNCRAFDYKDAVFVTIDSHQKLHRKRIDLAPLEF